MKPSFGEILVFYVGPIIGTVFLVCDLVCRCLK